MNDEEYAKYRSELFATLWSEVPVLGERIEHSDAEGHAKVRPDLFDLMSRTRLWGAMIPEEFGGLDLNITQYLPILAELSKLHGGVRVVVHVHNSMSHTIKRLGSPAQRAELLPGFATGALSPAFALTEPDRGTGADLGTTLRRDGDDYVINGRKHLISNSDFASHFIAFGQLQGEKGSLGVTAVIVPRGTSGLTIRPLPETMGCKGGEHGELTFVEVRVPVAAVLGGEGAGLDQMEEALEISRVFVAASSLGTAERALELSVAHSKERSTFGKPLANRQAIQRYLAEMAMDVYALRLMLNDCAARWDRNERMPGQASSTKLFGLEAVGRVTDRALLVHGGIGYTQAREIERLYRDARLNWLEEGTPTIQHLVIAREVLSGRTV